MNAIRNFIRLSTKPMRQEKDTVDSDTPKGMFSRALVSFNDFYLESLALWNLSSGNTVLLNHSDSNAVGNVHESDFNEYAFDLMHTEQIALHTSQVSPTVDQQGARGRVVVKLLWNAEEQLADGETKDLTDISEIVNSGRTAVDAASFTTTTLVGSRHRTSDANEDEGTNDEERCRSFPLDAVRRLLSTEFEFSTELNDEFYSRRYPGTRLDSLPIIYENLRRTREGSM